MKTICALILILVIQPGYGQTDSVSTCNVFILRATGFTASARQFKIFVDGNLACKIQNNKYVVLELPPGKHSFAMQLDGKQLKQKTERREILTQEGKNYYLSSLLEMGAFSNRIRLDELSEESGHFRLKKLGKASCTR